MRTNKPSVRPNEFPEPLYKDRERSPDAIYADLAKQLEAILKNQYERWGHA